MDSILTSIKKLVGVSEDYAHFDDDIIMHINTSLMTLNQLGVGPEEGFTITSDEQTWADFLNETELKRLEAIKTYIYLNVKMLFDPPASATILDAMDRKAKEYEWRLQVQAETEV